MQKLSAVQVKKLSSPGRHANGFDFILSGAYWITFFPGLMLLATVAAINIFGDQLRTIINPKLSL